jgi:biopolymer transport protein ExbB
MKKFKFCFPFFLLPGILSAEESASTGTLNLLEVYQGAPWIYILLLVMSMASFAIWLYSLISWRISDMMPKEFLNKIRQLIAEKHFEAALSTCRNEQNFSSGIIACGLAARKHGPGMMMETMQAEGRRAGNSLWQRISFLNEVAFVAPMLGLLGTVLGLFFAFYDTNRTTESLTAIFDGLGIAIGTTVAGLIVAILAMVFASILKFRVVNLLNTIENELLSLVSLTEVD